MSNLRPRAPAKKRRRGHGEDSIYQRPDGTWEAAISLGTHPGTGKRRRKKLTRRTKAELMDALQAEKQRGTSFMPTEKMTVGAWLNRWLGEIDVRPKTIDGYRSAITVHLVPFIGAMPLVSLTPAHVQTYFAERKKAGAATRQMQIALVVLRSALENARKLGLVEHNAAAEQDAPKHVKAHKSGAETFCYDLPQALKLLDTAREHMPSEHALLALALDSGARQGEIFGLQWSDLDFTDPAAAVWSVQHNLIVLAKNEDADAAEAAGKGIVVAPKMLLTTTPKTADGTRTIVLSQSCTEALLKHREGVGGRLAKGFVFVSTNGKPLRNENHWRRVLQPLERLAGLPRLTFHGLRHTTATVLLEADVPVHVVSHRLGHADVKITLGTYGHVLSAMARRAAKTAGDLFGGGSGQRSGQTRERGRTTANDA